MLQPPFVPDTNNAIAFTVPPAPETLYWLFQGTISIFSLGQSHSNFGTSRLRVFSNLSYKDLAAIPSVLQQGFWAWTLSKTCCAHWCKTKNFKINKNLSKCHYKQLLMLTLQSLLPFNITLPLDMHFIMFLQKFESVTETKIGQSQ